MNNVNFNKFLPEKDNTCAIITIFNPDQDIFENINKIKCQVNYLILIINQCDQNTLSNLIKQLPNADKHHIIHNPENMGLAHALNQGLDFAYNLEIDWALLLDQDTSVDSDIIQTLSNTINDIPENNFLIGSNYRSKKDRLEKIKVNKQEKSYLTVSTIITSGTLLSIESYKKIGSFIPEYFIDSIDHEYSLRAKCSGYNIFITSNPVMTHDIGIRDNNWSDRLQCFFSQSHTPERKYYVIRNTIITANKYIKKFPLWSLRQYLRVIADLISTLVFENQKQVKLRYSFDAIRYGLNNELHPGPLESRNE